MNQALTKIRDAFTCNFNGGGIYFYSLMFNVKQTLSIFLRDNVI